MSGKETDGRLPQDASFELFSEKLDRQIEAIMFREGKNWGSPRKVDPSQSVLGAIPTGGEVILRTVGRYHLAMQVYEAWKRGAFHPMSETFDINWKNTPQDLSEFEDHIKTHIGESAPAHVRQHFLKALQKQVSEGETWKYLDFKNLRYERLKTFKDSWTEAAVVQAAFSAKRPVSVRPPVMFCFLKDDRGCVTAAGVLSPDGSYPPTVDGNSQRHLSDCLADLRKIDGGRFQRYVRSMESSTDLLTDGTFVEFKTSDFEPYQLLQLLHVQFRLALGFPALVEEGFNPKLA